MIISKQKYWLVVFLITQAILPVVGLHAQVSADTCAFAYRIAQNEPFTAIWHTPGQDTLQFGIIPRYNPDRLAYTLRMRFDGTVVDTLTHHFASGQFFVNQNGGFFQSFLNDSTLNLIKYSPEFDTIWQRKLVMGNLIGNTMNAIEEGPDGYTWCTFRRSATTQMVIRFLPNGEPFWQKEYPILEIGQADQIFPFENGIVTRSRFSGAEQLVRIDNDGTYKWTTSVGSQYTTVKGATRLPDGRYWVPRYTSGPTGPSVLCVLLVISPEGNILSEVNALSLIPDSDTYIIGNIGPVTPVQPNRFMMPVSRLNAQTDIWETFWMTFDTTLEALCHRRVHQTTLAPATRQLFLPDRGLLAITSSNTVNYTDFGWIPATCAPINCIIDTISSVATPREAPVQLTCYPNPANTTVRVEWPWGAENSQLTVLNMQGQVLLYEQVGTVQYADIQIKQWPDGWYLVYLITENGERAITRFLKH